MIIALMGTDGTGKTAIATALIGKLSRIKVDAEYRQGFAYGVLGFFMHLFPRSAQIAVHSRKSSKFVTSSLLLIWPFLVFLDCIITSLYMRLFKRRKIVVFDRYFYDFLVAFENLGCCNGLIRKLFLFLPRANVAFILDVSPKVAYERTKLNHTYNITHYAVQRQRYLEISRALRLLVINTERPLTLSVEEVFTQLQPLLH